MVLFESQDFEGPSHIGSASIEDIENKQQVQLYLNEVEYIPHIEKRINMVSTKDIKIN